MLESWKRNRKGIILMVLSALCACVGQLFWKLSAKSFIYLVLGFGFYGVGALLMLVAYRFGRLSVLQPILSINYVLSLILGVLVLKEVVFWWNCLGVLVVMGGVALIAGGDEN